MPWKTCFHDVENRRNRRPWGGNNGRLETRGGLSCGERGQRGQKWVPCHGTFRKSGFHGVETAEFDFHAVELFRGCRKTTTLPAGGGKCVRRPRGHHSRTLPPKAPSPSSSASTPPRQRQQPLNPVGALTLPPPLAFAHWNWQHFPIGNIKNEFLASKCIAARESRRFPLFHAWCMGGGLQFVGRWCNLPARDV